MGIDIREIGSMMTNYFTSPKISQIAYKSGFVQRSSAKLSGLLFLQAFVFASLEHVTITLSKVAQSCADLGLPITEQGLDDRINQSSVTFMQEMFAEAMRMLVNKQPLMVPVLAQFSAVNLIDSSGIPLPVSMAGLYPASRNIEAANLKLRLVFDFLHGHLQQVLFVPGKEADQGFEGYLTTVKVGSLNIMDLGHFNLDNFKAMANKQAFYLSRYKHRTTVLTPDGVEIDLLERLAGYTQNVVELAVLLGKSSQHRLPCRLVAFRLKQEVADQRRRKAKDAAKRRGQTVSPRTLALLDWSIYLTNAPTQRLTPPQIACLYRVRWQIELLFKLVKSYFGLRRFAQLRPERILTELYAKLIAVVLTLFLVGPLRMPLADQPYREISPVKVRQICQRFARTISQLIGDLDRLTEHLHLMVQHILTFGFKQKRKKKPNICHALMLVSAMLELPPQVEQPLAEFLVLDFSDIVLTPT
jgi:hypothetical protein